MIHLLSPEGREAVGRIARERALLAFDFDGTLAPLVDDPREAWMRAHTRALLRAVATLFPCAVISGRARADVLARLGDAHLRAVIGNHGAERGDARPRVGRARAAAWAAALRDALHDEEGVEVEDKGLTVAVHYRRARWPEAARKRIVQLAALLPGVRLFGGHDVVNLAPVGAPTKADAIEAFSIEFPPAPLAFFGDDETDEDAFRSHVVTFAVRIGPSETSAARYHLEHQAEIDAVLWAIVSERARVSGLGDGWQELDPARNPGGGA
jgi:trehalose 6-phosphate phosphatase